MWKPQRKLDIVSLENCVSAIDDLLDFGQILAPHDRVGRKLG
jgi:hypothetical protein